MQQTDPFERAMVRLWPHRTFRHSERNMAIACLIRTADWRPLDAPWWRGKEVCIIGADLDGNFFCGIAMGQFGIGITDCRPKQLLHRVCESLLRGLNEDR